MLRIQSRRGGGGGGGSPGAYVGGEVFVIRAPAGATNTITLKALDFRGRHLKGTYNGSNDPDDEDIYALQLPIDLVVGDEPSTNNMILIGFENLEVFIDPADGFLKCRVFSPPMLFVAGLTVSLQWTDNNTGMSHPTHTLT